MKYLSVGKADAESLIVRSVELARQAVEEHLAEQVCRHGLYTKQTNQFNKIAR